MPPQPITSSGSGARTASGTAASGAGQSDAAIHFHGARGRQHPQFGAQSGRFGQAQRLRLQARQSLR